jgi:hypothetical protein
VDPSRPEVTVTDPSRPGDRFVAVPLVDAPEDEARPGRRRRVLAVVLAALLVGAAVLVGTDLAERRRLDGIAAVGLVAAAPPAQQWSSDAATGDGTVETVVELRNSGPRAVRVVRAQLGGLRATEPVRIAAGATAGVPLSGTWSCPPFGTRPSPDRVGPFVLGVETRRGLREVVVGDSRLLRQSASLAPQRACGFPPLEDAVFVAAQVSPGAADPSARTADVRLHVAHGSLRTLRVVSVGFARGFDVVSLRRTGRGTSTPVDLPIVLPVPEPDRAATVSFDTVLGLSCAAVRSTGGGVLFGDVDVLVEDADDGDLRLITGRVDGARVLRQLVEDVCALG